MTESVHDTSSNGCAGRDGTSGHQDDSGNSESATTNTECAAADPQFMSATTALTKRMEGELRVTIPDLPPPSLTSARDAVLSKTPLSDYERHLSAVATKVLALYLFAGRSLAEAAAAVLKGLDTRLSQLGKLLAQTNPYTDYVTEKTPWTTINVVGAVMLVIVSVGLLASDLNTVATILVATGVPGMDDKASALIWSLVPVGLAVALKSLFHAVPGDTPKRRYTVGVLIASILLSIIWAFLLPRCFDPHLGQSPGEIIVAAATAADGPSSSTGALFITVGMLCSGLLAGACWCTLEAIAASHRVSRRATSPLYRKTSRDLAALGKLRSRIAHVKGGLDGRIKSIEAAVEVFVQEGKTQYRLAERAYALENQAHDDFVRRIEPARQILR